MTYTIWLKGQLRDKNRNTLCSQESRFSQLLPWPCYVLPLPDSDSPSTAATALPWEPVRSRYCLWKRVSWVWPAARCSVADGLTSAVSHRGSADTPRCTSLYAAGDLCSFARSRGWELFAVHVRNWCESSRRDCKVSHFLLKETVQKLLQRTATMWFLKPEVFCLTLMQNMGYQNVFYS